ncbi:MAG: KH domain-containing protein [Candidatus Carbobacillus altaicus]|nr:KH domain-containing protein [Candidatus Carbobacillus altaicus]
MREALEYLVRGMVDHPDEVHVSEAEDGETTVYAIWVHEADKGRVIGRSGQTANALRQVAYAIAAKHGKRIRIDIVS